MSRKPKNALLYWLGSGLLGIAIIVWRLTAKTSLDAFFSKSGGIVVTAIAVLLIAMAVIYAPRAYRATCDLKR